MCVCVKGDFDVDFFVLSLLPFSDSSLIPPQLEGAQQENRQLEEERQAAESQATQTETQLMAERREREGEKREKEEKVWELSQKLQDAEEQLAQTEAMVSITPSQKNGNKILPILHILCGTLSTTEMLATIKVMCE